MVRQHQHHEEMRLQLRDNRIHLHYLDAFGMDIEPPPFLIRVYSPGATLLEYMKLALAVWAFFVSLAFAAFWEVMPFDRTSQVDMCFDAAYFICLVLQLRTSLLEVKQGQEICCPRRIFTANVTGLCFWVDIVTCVPLALAEVLFRRSQLLRWVAVGKSLRGWRVFRLPPKHRFIPSMKFILVRLFVALFMGGHFLACVWFILVYEKEKTIADHVDMEFRGSNWERCTQGTSSDGSCFYTLYSLSLNTGVYLLMGSNRDANSAWEHFYLTICMPVGSLVHAYVLGEVILSLQRRGALETRRNENTMAVREAMRILGLPPSLQVRIITYSTYETLHRSGRLFHELFKGLSPQLRFELQLHLYLDLVTQSGLFRDMRPRVIREIIVNLQDLIFLPGDWVCRYRDYGDSMYFIVKGVCTVIGRDTTTQLKRLERGACFGEVALLRGMRRTAYVRAGTFCILAHLTKGALEPILQKWPDQVDVLLQNVEVEADRLKIKEECARLYGLKRVSCSSTATLGTCDSKRGSVAAASDAPLAALPAPIRIMRAETAEDAVPERGAWRKSKTLGDETGRLGPLLPGMPEPMPTRPASSMDVDGPSTRSSAFLSPVMPARKLQRSSSCGPRTSMDTGSLRPPASTRTSLGALLHEEPHDKNDSFPPVDAILAAEEQLNELSAVANELAQEVETQRRVVTESLASFREEFLQQVRETMLSCEQESRPRGSTLSDTPIAPSEGLGMVL